MRLTSKTRFIWLRHRDEVRQAISWAKAVQSDEWSTRAPSKYQGRYVYDFPGIMLALRRIRWAEKGWRRFFERCGVEPLTLYYEDYLVDRQAAIRAVSELVAEPQVFAPSLQKDPIEIQSDAVNKNCEERYRRDTQNAISTLRAFTSAAASPSWWSTCMPRWAQG